MRRRVGEQLQVVRRVLVVRGRQDGDGALEEGLRERVVAEERVAVDAVQLAVPRRRQRAEEAILVEARVQAEQVVKPPLHCVAARVADGRGQLHLAEAPPEPRVAAMRRGGLGGGAPALLVDLLGALLAPGAADGGCSLLRGRLLAGAALHGAQLLEQLEAQRAPGALVAGDGGGEEDEAVAAEHALHEGQRDGRRLIDREQLRLCQRRRVAVRRDVRDALPVVPEDDDAADDLRVAARRLRGRAAAHLKVEVLLVAERPEARDEELEDGLQVLHRRGGDAHVAVPVAKGRGEREAQRRGLAAAAGGGDAHGRPQRLLLEHLDARHHGARLVEGAGLLDQRANDLRLGEALAQRCELRVVLGRRVVPASLGGGHVDGARRAGERQHVQLVVQHQAVVAPPEAQDEALVKAARHVREGLRAEPRVHVHRHRVQLLQALDRPQEQDDGAAALHRLHRAREEVGCERLKVLEHAHAERAPEHALRVLVVAPGDVRARDEELEGIVRGRVVKPAGGELLELTHALLAVRREPELLLVAPQHRGPRADAQLGEQVVEVRHLVLAVVSHDDQQRPRPSRQARLEQGAHAAVHLLLHHARRGPAGALESSAGRGAGGVPAASAAGSGSARFRTPLPAEKERGGLR